MNRKSSNKKSPGYSGPDTAGKLVENDAGNYLEYENTPDPISFDEPTKTQVQAAKSGEQSASKHIHPPAAPDTRNFGSL